MKPGDYVEVECAEESIHGILVPSTEQQKDFTVIKLSSGYNIGIHKRNIKTVNVLEEQKPKNQEKKEVEQNEKLPKITVLHTGGTIASKVDYESGAVSAKFSAEELLELFPEFKDIANIESRLVANMLSENMRFSHYNKLAKEVEKEVEKGSQGVIVTHGTDTLHYTAAALSFALENLPVPVILVGAQRSSDRGSSDSAANLISAVAFAANANFCGVAVCMHEDDSDGFCSIIDGTHARKMHTSKRDAFKSINLGLLSRINYESKKIEHINMKSCKPIGAFKVLEFDDKIKVGFLKTHPNMFEDEISFKHFDGLVIEGTGLGHAPIEQSDDYTKENLKILKRIEELAKRIPVVMASQCIYGRINLNVYSPGRKLKKIGVLGHELDMMPETAFVKLAWLLSNFKEDKVRELFGTNLRGEITERSEQDGYAEAKKKKK